MRIVGQEQIAEVFGVAPKTIVEWQEAGFPIAVRGSPGIPSEYDTAPCINWLVDREVGKVQGESQRDRLYRLQADQVEREAARDDGKFLPASEIEPKWHAAVLAAREYLLRAAPRLAVQMERLDRRAREALLRANIDEFLRRLAAWRSDGNLEPEADE